jgi:hypothetical protein
MALVMLFEEQFYTSVIINRVGLNIAPVDGRPA